MEMIPNDFGGSPPCLVVAAKIVAGLLLLVLTAGPVSARGIGPMVVGVFDLDPLCCTHGKQPKGRFFGLLEEIAHREKWSLEYRLDDLDRHRVHLEVGAIDLLVGAPHDPSMAAVCDFSKETIISTWGQIYTSPRITVQTVLDLGNLTVGIVRGDPYAAELRNIIDRLNIQCRLVEFKQYGDIVHAMESGWIDAGALDRFFCASREDMKGISKTPIIFSPIELRFAVPKGDDRQILAALDYHLGMLKKNSDSIYYRFLQDTFGEPENAILVSALRYGVGILGGCLLLSMVMGNVLRRQVKARTAELTEKNLELGRELAQRQMAESATRRGEAERLQLATVIEQSSESVFIMDTDRIIQYVNPAFEAMSGYLQHEAMGRKPDFLHSDAHSPDTLNQIELSIASGNTWTGRVYNLNKSGQRFIAETKISPLRDPQGKVTGYVNIKRDVTAEVQLQEQLTQAQKLQAIGQLAGGIAHDFNNILAGIMGFTELAMIQAGPDKAIERHLNGIFTGCRRARDLVNQILTFSRRQTPEKRNLKIQPVLMEALKLVRATIPSSIEIQTDFPKDKPVVSADPTQIHQMVINLCTNAAHAMASHGGVLRVGLSETRVSPKAIPPFVGLKEGSYLVLTISDDGHGMSREVREKLFDPFFTTKETGRGTGLGLSVVHGIVKSHGGAIAVESEPGKGSTFRVYLPAAGETGSTEPATAPKPRGGSETILFVDDEPTLGLIAKESLESLGYAVVPTTSSTEALKWVEADPARFHLVITDRTMPNLSGIELSRKIKAIRKDLPLIMCTGLFEAGIESLAESAGIGQCISKPLERVALAAAVRKALGDREKAQPSETPHPSWIPPDRLMAAGGEKNQSLLPAN